MLSVLTGEEKMKCTVNNSFKTPYYVFYADEFIENYKALEKAFKSIYNNYQLAYSFKTNYTPAVCNLVKELGGYAEVVSDMEYELALKIGFPTNKIVYNGPGKGDFVEHCLLGRGLLNIDNLTELDKVCNIALKYPDKWFEVGLRINFNIGTDLHSRFGIDVTNGDFEIALNKLKVHNISVTGLHFHISRARSVDAWEKRIISMLDVANKYFNGKLKYIDIGSGMFGKLDPELQKQFGPTPTYQDYAEKVALKMAEYYDEYPQDEKPLLITEPGTTVVSKYFHLFSTVLDIKEIRNKHYALLDCSFHNVGEICGLKQVPITVKNPTASPAYYNGIDLVGYTCLEQDVIRSNYCGNLEKGSIVEVYNVGGYSIVEKPPFIHPDIPIYMHKSGEQICIKRSQTFDDIFAPYVF